MSKEPVQPIIRTESVEFSFDGKSYAGHKGETVAAALLRQGILQLRDAPNSTTPRGMFCVMGICQECVVEINGKRKEACRTAIAPGLVIDKVKY